GRPPSTAPERPHGPGRIASGRRRRAVPPSAGGGSGGRPSSDIGLAGGTRIGPGAVIPPHLDRPIVPNGLKRSRNGVSLHGWYHDCSCYVTHPSDRFP